MRYEDKEASDAKSVKNAEHFTCGTIWVNMVCYKAQKLFLKNIQLKNALNIIKHEKAQNEPSELS